MQSVSNLCNIHGTDKESYHGYAHQVYDPLFLPYRDKKIELLEIGVYKGNSIKVWTEYFHKGFILGVDCDDQWNKEGWTFYPANGAYLKGNAYDSTLISPEIEFDIIIDDGPHGLIMQQQSLELYLPRVREGGLFIIEDVASMGDAHELAKFRTPDLVRQCKTEHSIIMVWKK